MLSHSLEIESSCKEAKHSQTDKCTHTEADKHLKRQESVQAGPHIQIHTEIPLLLNNIVFSFYEEYIITARTESAL